ncbi:hypothetical protein M405DRAFT_895808, partial [Rhizopogon salebrosus TDB-379]
LDSLRTSRPAVFGQPPKPWPSEDDFETLAFKAGSLFVYATMAMNFISAAGHHPQQRLALLLHEKSTVGADIDQLYRQIIETSQNPLIHCRMLASIIHLRRTFRLVELQKLFYDDQETLAVTLEIFSPVILNPPDGNGNVEVYHASLRDFMSDPLRSKHYHVDDTHTEEHLAICCLHLLLRDTSHSRVYEYAQLQLSAHSEADLLILIDESQVYTIEGRITRFSASLSAERRALENYPSQLYRPPEFLSLTLTQSGRGWCSTLGEHVTDVEVVQ